MTKDKYEEIRANGNHVVEHGTMTRGHGQKMHAGWMSWYEFNGETTPPTYGSSCHCGYGGVNANHWDFEQYFNREVTCKTCIKANLQGRVTGDRKNHTPEEMRADILAHRAN